MRRNATTLAAHFATSVVVVESVGRASGRGRESVPVAPVRPSRRERRPLTWAAGQALSWSGFLALLSLGPVLVLSPLSLSRYRAILWRASGDSRRPTPLLRIELTLCLRGVTVQE